MNGKYVVKTAIDNDYTLSVTALNFNNGQYKKIAERSFEKLCSFIYNSTFREYFEEFQASQLYPVQWKTCPYPTGSNEIKNYQLGDLGSVFPPYIPGGEKWKIEIRFLKDEEALGGWNVLDFLRSDQSLLG